MAQIALPRRHSRLARKEALWGYIFLLPWIIGFLVFIAGPMIASLYLGFTSYSIGPKFPTWIGFDNYVYAFTKDPQFWNSIIRTFEYAILIVPTSIVGSLLAAQLLNQRLKATTWFRTFFFLPHLTPAVAAVVVWIWLLNPQYGLVNDIIYKLTHQQGPGWLASPEWAIPSLVMIALWGAIGGNQMIIFLAGLQGIPHELYEAADIDGANSFQKFFNVTLPLLTPTIFFNLVLGIIGALQTFTTAFVGTGGGPAYSTWFYALHIYNQAFSFSEMGYACALAWIFFIILLIFTAVQFRASLRWVYYQGEVQ